MILVTGVTGTVGGEVARLLAARPAAEPVRVLVRDPARPRSAPPGAEVATGAYGDRAALLRALRGVRAAFLVTTDVAAHTDAPADAGPGRSDDARFAAAAVAAGVLHVVKLSAYTAGEAGADDLIARWHRAAEKVIRGSGLGWTILRPRAFMSNTLAWAPSVRAEGVVRAVHPSSHNACVDPRDVAEAAVRALTGPGHADRVYPLTGPEAVSAAEQTEQLARALRRPLRCEELTLEEAAGQWARRYPPAVVEALLSSAERQARGGKAAVDPAFTRLTGRRARPYRQWAADHREAFA